MKRLLEAALELQAAEAEYSALRKKHGWGNSEGYDDWTTEVVNSLSASERRVDSAKWEVLNAARSYEQ